MPENKTKQTELSVADFIDAVGDERARTDVRALVDWMREASGEEPKMWGPSIIGFGSYHYKYESGREGDMPVIGLAPRKAALTLYGMRLEESADVLEGLGKHTTGKGCLYIKKLADVDPGVLKTLLGRAVAARKRASGKD